MVISLAYLRTPSGILKIVEIITVVVSFIIFRATFGVFGKTEDANYFGIGVLVTAMIITPLLLICYIMGRYEIQKTIFEIVFNFLMFLLLMTAGAVAIDAFNYPITVSWPNDIDKKSRALGSFCILSSLAYLADTVCAVCLYRQ